jgi:hypothetical protein
MFCVKVRPAVVRVYEPLPWNVVVDVPLMAIPEERVRLPKIELATAKFSVGLFCNPVKLIFLPRRAMFALIVWPVVVIE